MARFKQPKEPNWDEEYEQTSDSQAFSKTTAYDARALYEQPGQEYEPEDYQQEFYPADTYPEDSYSEDAYPQDDLAYEEPEKIYRRTIFKPRTRKPNFALSIFVNAVRLLLLFVVIAGLCGVGIIAGIAKGYMETAPTLDLAKLDEQAQTSFIYDANGALITEYKGVENRIMVSISAMPAYLQNAFVACEDARFFTHNGVDIKRIVGAFVSNLSSSSTQGGSTITQQLIKQTILSDEQSYKRKIQEAYLAMQLEATYEKSEILEAYLNTIYLGENYYGVQVAANGYFGKALKDLTLRECAMLAGMTRNPYYYNPRRNYYLRENTDTVDYAAITNNRTNYVLRCMYDNQFITKQQYEDALNPATAAVMQTAPVEGTGMYKYAHYVEYAVKDIVDAFLTLEKLENNAENRYKMEQKFRTGGYRVRLAIDTGIQDILEATVESYTNWPKTRDPADKVYRPRNADGTYTDIPQPQVACVVLDYRTGELKAMVGGRERPTQKKTLNRATDMKMPVGSSIKPIAVYAPALELGGSPASVVYNMPVPIPGWKNSKGEDYWPQNYGGGNYSGPETLRNAMKDSHNTAAAQALMTMVGVDRSVDFLLQMGIDKANIDATPYGLSLGSSGITPMQMAVAFGVLANGGVYQQPLSFLGISDSNGSVIWDSHQRQVRRQVFKPSTAFMIVDMLKTAVASGTGSAAKLNGQTVGGKTGTNSDQRGVFFCGMTGYYVSSIWVGHDGYKPLSSKTTGGNGAIPVWKSYMQQIHKDLPNKDIISYSAEDCGLVKVTTCVVSGQLATAACQKSDINKYGTSTDYWAAASRPITECQMHKTMTVCIESGMLATEFCPLHSVSTQGVAIIPRGHPLYSLIGTKYNDTLTQYLGAFSTLRYSGDANANDALNLTVACNLHNQYTAQGSSYVVETTLRPDAERLLASAQERLNAVEAGSDSYNNLLAAIQNLQGALGQAEISTSSLTSAMSYLTQAMVQ